MRECHVHDPTRFRPFRIEGVTAGWIRHDLAEQLGVYAGVFELGQGAVELAPGLRSFEERSRVVDAVVHDLDARGLVRLMGHEFYPVAPAFAAPPWLQMERSALPAFGVRAYGIHLNGFVRRDDEPWLWIARRARDKSTYPGQLDNIVAGGQPIGLSLRQNLIKECAEEASIPAPLASCARPCGAVSYKLETTWGLRNDVLFLYELELPGDFVPVNTDGEVESFELWPLERVRETVAQTRAFKFNSNLTMIEFLLRHGAVRPEDPEHDALVTALRR